VTFSERYKDVSSPAEIEELNRNFMKRMKTLEAVLDEAADGLKLVKANRERSCLGQFLRAVLDEAVGPKHHVFKLGTEEDGLPVGEFPADFDASLLQKAFEELIQNCRKALGQRQDLMMTVTLSTATRLGVGLCRIDVRDNGPGIAKEKLTEIFEEFFTEWPDPETRGTGLGLSYVQSVVAAHRGRIVAMESDCGAWFRIEFPRFKSQGQRAANTASRIDSGGTS
jgi:signal transduction histidine kinase